MVVESARVNELEKKVLTKMVNEVHFYSRFKFINAHNGFRRGKMHVILGNPSSGKSTLTRSLMADAASNEGVKILLHLSEETEIDYKTEIAKLGRVGDALANVDIVSELGYYKKSQCVLTDLEKLIKENEYDIVFLDNITTSATYKEYLQQEATQRILKQIAIDWNIALIVVAHTGKEINSSTNRLINVNDVRGSRSLANLAEFWYTLQNFVESENIHPTVHLEKHRGYNPGCKFYYLNYNPKYMSYTGDNELNFEAFNELYKSRNRLNDR